MKGIFVRDIVRGDVISLDDRKRISVRGTLAGEHGPERELFIHVFDDAGGQHILRPGGIVGLLHRPWPEGKCNGDMLSDICVRAHEVDMNRGYAIGVQSERGTAPPLEAAIAKLREAVDAWQLGRPYDDYEVVSEGIFPAGCALRSELAD